MDLDKKQLKGKPRKVGTLHGKAVTLMVTKGGYHFISSPKGASYEILGAGPHRRVAQHIANKYEPDIVWSEFSKSEHDISAYALILPKWEEITERIRAHGI